MISIGDKRASEERGGRDTNHPMARAQMSLMILIGELIGSIGKKNQMK